MVDDVNDESSDLGHSCPIIRRRHRPANVYWPSSDESSDDDYGSNYHSSPLRHRTSSDARRASGCCQSSFYRPLASIVMSAVFMKIRKFKMAAEREISAAVRAL